MNVEARRTLQVVCAAGMLLLAISVVGANHARDRLLGLITLSEDAARRAAERQLRIHAWQLPDGEEQRLWQSVADQFAATVPLSDVRLAVPEELTGLAARCGLERVQLSEIGPVELTNAYYDAFEELIDPVTIDRSADIDEIDEADLPWAADDRAQTEAFGYRLRFEAGHGELLDFLRGLERGRGMIEVRQASIRGGKSDLEVTLTLAAHRRRT